MDFKKKYEGALVRAKMFKGQHPTRSESDLIDAIFPELAESEDDRMRKAIQIALSLDDAKGYLRSWGISYERADAWLEKQKESLRVSETYKENADSFTDEDERIRKHIIKILDSLAPCHWDGNEKAKCIASLERQKEQKPAEWSEEDESHLIHTIHLIEDVSEWAKKDGMHGRCVASCDEILPWLKSLRPQHHWKPTEEQMNKLNIAIACYDGDWGEDNAKPLRELFEQLKKL